MRVHFYRSWGKVLVVLDLVVLAEVHDDRDTEAGSPGAARAGRRALALRSFRCKMVFSKTPANHQVVG